MATIYRPRNSINHETPDRWRGNHVRRNGMLNLRMQPAIGYEHHRGSVVGFTLLIGLVFILAFGLIQLFTPSVSYDTATPALVITPAVTVQLVGASTALPVMSVPPSVSMLVTINDASGEAIVHTGPGTGYGALGTLPNGEMATLIGRSADGQWWLISFQGRIGWVDASFARFDGDLSQVPVAEAQ